MEQVEVSQTGELPPRTEHEAEAVIIERFAEM